MGFFSRLKNIFSGRAASAPETPKSGGGFWERMKQSRQERKQAREWKRSQERMEKMEQESLKEKARRKAEEKEKKKADQKRREAAHEKGRDTFKENWGFSDREYDDFIQFIDGASDEIKEVFGSNNLVEAFRTGRSLGLSPNDLKNVLDQTYNMTEGGTQEDIINDLYMNMSAYAESVREGSYV